MYRFREGGDGILAQSGSCMSVPLSINAPTNTTPYWPCEVRDRPSPEGATRACLQHTSMHQQPRTSWSSRVPVRPRHAHRVGSDLVVLELDCWCRSYEQEKAARRMQGFKKTCTIGERVCVPLRKVGCYRWLETTEISGIFTLLRNAGQKRCQSPLFMHWNREGGRFFACKKELVLNFRATAVRSTIETM